MNPLDEIEFGFGRCTVDGSLPDLLSGRIHDAGAGMSGEERPVGHAEVDILVTIDIGDPAAVSLGDEEGVGGECPDGAGDSSGSEFLGFLIELCGPVHGITASWRLLLRSR